MRTVLLATALLALACVRSAYAQCSSFLDVATCENPNATASGCYWQTYELPHECRPVPTLNADCECKRVGGCVALPPSGETSGCQPQRFCQYSLASTCIVVNPPINDDACKFDGRSDTCVPTEFCEPTTIFATACRIIVPPTPKPTASPQVPTFKPTRAPTPFKVVTDAPAISVPLVAGGAVAGAVVLGIGLFVIFFVRRSSDTQAMRGVITADEYLSHAKPRVPRPPKREEMTREQMEAQGMKLIVSFDFEGENDDELSVRQGTWLIGLVRYDEWWEARTADGEFGIIPIAYVTEVGLTDGIVDADNLRAIDNVEF